MSRARAGSPSSAPSTTASFFFHGNGRPALRLDGRRPTPRRCAFGLGVLARTHCKQLDPIRVPAQAYTNLSAFNVLNRLPGGTKVVHASVRSVIDTLATSAASPITSC